VRSYMGDRIDELADRIDAITARNASDVARCLAIFTRWSEINKGLVDVAAPHARAAATLAEVSPVDYVVILGRYVAAVHAWITGHAGESLRQFNIAMDRWDAVPAGERRPPIRLGRVAAIAASSFGDTATAERGLTLADPWFTSPSTRPIAEVDAAFSDGLAAALSGDAQLALVLTKHAATSDAQLHLPHFSPAIRIVHAWALATANDSDEAVTDALAALDELDQGPTALAVPAFRTFAAEAVLRAGDAAGAVELLERARADARRTGDVWWLAETLRLLAEAAAATGAAAHTVLALLDEADETAAAHGQPQLAARVAASRTRHTGP
jgi:hypothetical protein